MAILLTGAAGFIGSNIIKNFLSIDRVFAVDNMSLGSYQNIDKYKSSNKFQFIEHDLSCTGSTVELFEKLNESDKINEVWHFAANSDIPAGVNSADIDLKDTFMTTFSTLEGMKKIGAKKLYFASSSAVYGDMGAEPISENAGPLLPISNYGAMKLASEAIISAAAESFLDVALMFRFPNVVGVPATHGVILDFVRKLNTNNNVLQVLGNGTQKKIYLHVNDLIQAMIYLRNNSDSSVDVFNVGPNDDGVFVRQIAEEVVLQTFPNAEIQYGTDDRGWLGDVPKFSYSVEKLKKSGWNNSSSSHETIQQTVREIVDQEISKP